MIQVLQGLKVVEQGTFITGPAAGMLLGDLGADVIKVELPVTGDPFRAFNGGLYSPHFQTYNRNKRSIELNTQARRRPQGVRRADRRCRCLHPELPPGRGRQARRRREARLRALNPKLIYCSISGFGATGPAAARPAYDTVAQAASGFLEPAGQPAEPACRRPGHRRCADRLLRRLRRARRAVRARPHRPSGARSRCRCSRRWRTSTSMPSRTSSRSTR